MSRPDVPVAQGTGSKFTDEKPPLCGHDLRIAHEWIGHFGPILEAHPLPTAVLDATGRLLLLNHAARHLLEVSAQGALPDLGDLLHPDEIDRALRLRRDFLHAGAESVTAVLRWHTGRGNPLMLRVTVQRMAMAQGPPLLLVGFEDQSRLHALEIARRQHGTGVALSRLGADSAHSLLSCLAAIRLRTQECRLDTSALSEHLGAIDDACRRAASITFPLLAFSRHRDVRTRTLDLVAHVEHVLNELATLVGDHQRLEWTLPSHPCIVLGDETLLEQVLVHLVSSAIQASAPGARITVRLCEVVDPVEPAASGGGLRHQAMLEVHDDGEPFVDVHELQSPHARDDRAVGMAIVRRVILGMDGTVQVDSGSQGTTVTLRIPLAQPVQKAVQKPVPLPHGGKVGDGEVALRRVVGVVDSNPRRRAIMRHTLVTLGYDVVECADIAELRARARTPRRPDALLIGRTAADGMTVAPSLFSVPVGCYGEAPMPSDDPSHDIGYPYLQLSASPMECQCTVGEFAERLLGGHGTHA